MVIRIRGGKSLYGALKYNADKLDEGRVLITNEIATRADGGDIRQ
jgi:hypothetical protein